jgi:hypothetical protein
LVNARWYIGTDNLAGAGGVVGVGLGAGAGVLAVVVVLPAGGAPASGSVLQPAARRSVTQIAAVVERRTVTPSDSVPVR